MDKKPVRVLEGAELDYWVGKAESLNVVLRNGECLLDTGNPNSLPQYKIYSPSSNWAEGGPIIEKYRIGILPPKREEHEDEWMGCDDIDENVGSEDLVVTTMFDYAPLVAAMRTFVAMRFGQFVDRESILH